MQMVLREKICPGEISIEIPRRIQEGVPKEIWQQDVNLHSEGEEKQAPPSRFGYGTGTSRK